MSELARVPLVAEVLTEAQPGSVGPVGDHALVGAWSDELHHLDARGASTVLDRSGLRVQAAAALPGGELILATGEGLRVWVEGTLASSPLADAIDGPVLDMTWGDERLWLHTGTRLYRFSDGELTEVRVQGAQLTGPFALAAHPQPRVWAATSAGLVAVDVDTLQPMERQEEVLATSLAADASGQVWATDGALLWERIGADDWTAYRPSVPARAVSAHPAGRGVWIHTDGPVLHALDGRIRAGTRSVPDRQAVDALGRLLVPDPSGLLRYGTRPMVAVAGLADGAALAARRTLLLAPSAVGELTELRAWVNDQELDVDPSTGEVLLDPMGLARDVEHRFSAEARWSDGRTARAPALAFQVDQAGDVTWEDDISWIYSDHCAICHGGSSETQLDTPEAWATRIDDILELVAQGAMPIGGAPLSDAQVAAIEAWRAADFP